MKHLVSSTAVALVLGLPASALAEPPQAGGDPAAAQALFYEARSLMKSGKHALACPKLEESLRLDYGIGTEFNLADCNEKLGKVSTAWSGFLAVASAAKAQGQRDRERVARTRAKALEARLPKLVIDVPSSSPHGLEVTRDGSLVGSASWGSPVPVDPGTHRVVASAPGREPWEGVVSATEGKVVRISVPAVLVAVTPAEAPAPALIAEREPRRPDPPPFPEPIIEQRGSTQRTVGWIVGGVGLAGLGLGAGFGIDSLQRRDRSRDHCNGDLCDREGVALRDRAIRSGDVATVTTVAGAAMLVGGVVLVLTAPRGPSRKEVPPTTSIRAVPHVAVNGGGISLQGVLP